MWMGKYIGRSRLEDQPVNFCLQLARPYLTVMSPEVGASVCRLGEEEQVRRKGPCLPSSRRY